MAIHRYQKTSGVIMRKTSAVDKELYNYSIKLVTTGRVTRKVGLFIIILGILLMARPHILYYELKRLGFEKDLSPPQAGDGDLHSF